MYVIMFVVNNRSPMMLYILQSLPCVIRSNEIPVTANLYSSKLFITLV